MPDWEHEAERFVMMTRPVSKVADDWLWSRWDEATERGRALVAKELLRRPAMSKRAEAVRALQRRPALIDALIEFGAAGTDRTRAGAARWIAAAGDDGDVVDLAADLLGAGGGLPAPLRDRLQTRPPAELPAPVARAVAEQLDGAGPMAAEWRRACLALFLADLPTCAHADQLLRSVGDDELVAALRARPADAGAGAAWTRVSAALPPARAAGLFARADPETAETLLREPLDLDPGDGTSPTLRLVPQLARTLDWADWPAALVTRLGASERALRRQRRALVILVGVLTVVTTLLVIALSAQQ